MRRFMKKVSTSNFAHQLVAYLIKGYIKFVYYTSSWRALNTPSPEQFILQNQSFIACFWHGRLAMIPQMWQWKSPMTALVSGHNDGVLVGRVFELFGVNCIKGSTNRGGTHALLQVIRALKKGNAIGMTPDGPRGPREIVNPGIILMAKASKAPIIPVSYAVKRAKTFDTWDRFMLPLPFNKGVFLWGDPIFVPEDASEEELERVREKVQEQLCTIQRQADELI